MGVYDTLQAWKDGKPIKSRTNLTTDGKNLYSYRLLIGFTGGDGKKILYLYQAPTGNFVSTTTSKHIGQAKGYADKEIVPYL